MSNEFAMGAIPSPIDERDYKIDDLIACSSTGIPTEYINPIAKEAPIFNQGASLTCVACSLALIRYLQEYGQSNNRDPFSVTYIYGNRSNGMYMGEGMVVREALKILKDNGDCHYADLPGFYDLNTSVKLCKNREGLYSKAHPFRISSYYYVQGAVQIQNAVMSLGAVSALFPVMNSLYSVKNDGVVKFNYNEVSNGQYHQMTIVGWDINGWIAINSWGDEWGDKGFCYIPFDYLITEAWAIVDKITEVYFKMAKFFDTKGHWAENSIEKALDNNIITGFDDGTFRPDDALTRAQFCVILDRLGLLDR